MATGDFPWPQEMSYGHNTYPMVIGDFLRPQEMSYGHRRRPMAIGDLLSPQEISHGHKRFPMAIGVVLQEISYGHRRSPMAIGVVLWPYEISYPPPSLFIASLCIYESTNHSSHSPTEFLSDPSTFIPRSRRLCAAIHFLYVFVCHLQRDNQDSCRVAAKRAEQKPWQWKKLVDLHDQLRIFIRKFL